MIKNKKIIIKKLSLVVGPVFFFCCSNTTECFETALIEEGQGDTRAPRPSGSSQTSVLVRNGSTR